MKPRYLLAILSGFMIGTSYIPFPPWAIFFCFVPLWLAWLEEDSFKRVFQTGWITQFILTLIGFNWVSYTVHEFGHMPWPVAILVLLLFASFANLHIPLAGLLWLFISRKLRLNEGGRIALLAVTMAFAERVFPMIFDWHFGYTWLYAGFPAFQLADVIGFLGLSTIGLAINAMVLRALRERAAGRHWRGQIATALTLFVVLNLLGSWHASSIEKPDSKVSMLLVQPNIGNQEKLMAEAGSQYRAVVLDRFVSLTRKGLAEAGTPDFVVWPETAFPEIMRDPDLNFGFPRRLKEALIDMNVHLITGGYTIHEEVRRVTNSFFVLNPAGQWMTRPYHKTILLAFGEYFPGQDYLPDGFVDKYFPEVGAFGRGPGPTVVEANGVKMGAQICYEGLFDWFTRKLANSGAHLIVNLTNDSWYGTWEQPPQHLYMTLARAIEVRRPLVRSTNTGISTVVLANGEILSQSPLHEEWFYLYEVPYVTNPRPTAFMTWGYWLIPGLLALSFLLILVKGRVRE